MSDYPVNKIDVQGCIKWEPKFFEPREEGQKLITVFSVEWQRPKSDKRSTFSVKTFGDLAQKLKDERIEQGDTVIVSGSLNESNWKDKKTDEWVKSVEIWALKVEIIERAGGGSGEFVAAGGVEDDGDALPF